jgi:hypothetical protein
VHLAIQQGVIGRMDRCDSGFRLRPRQGRAPQPAHARQAARKQPEPAARFRRLDHRLTVRHSGDHAPVDIARIAVEIDHGAGDMRDDDAIAPRVQPGDQRIGMTILQPGENIERNRAARLLPVWIETARMRHRHQQRTRGSGRRMEGKRRAALPRHRACHRFALMPHGRFFLRTAPILSPYP